MKLLIASCALILATGVLAGCGGLSAVPNYGCFPGSPCHPGQARSARIGFALRNPRRHWSMTFF